MFLYKLRVKDNFQRWLAEEKVYPANQGWLKLWQDFFSPLSDMVLYFHLCDQNTKVSEE